MADEIQYAGINRNLTNAQKSNMARLAWERFIDEEARADEHAAKIAFIDSFADDYEQFFTSERLKVLGDVFEMLPIKGLEFSTSLKMKNAVEKSFELPNGETVERGSTETTTTKWREIYSEADLCRYGWHGAGFIGDFSKKIMQYIINKGSAPAGNYTSELDFEKLGLKHRLLFPLIPNQHTYLLLDVKINNLNNIQFEPQVAIGFLTTDWISQQTYDLYVKMFEANQTRHVSEMKMISTIFRIILAATKYVDVEQVWPEVASIKSELFGENSSSVQQALVAINADDIAQLCGNMQSRGVESTYCETVAPAAPTPSTPSKSSAATTGDFSAAVSV